MGKDNQPKHRLEKRNIARKTASRRPIARVLIVCEGEKTEPNYLNAIRESLRLGTASIKVLNSLLGTDPLKVVDYAEQLFLKGDSHANLGSREFDNVFAVFDRDDHATYHAALKKCSVLNNKHRSNEGKAVPFKAVVSVPCFELWLLLHFEDVLAPLHRTVVVERLKKHLHDYTKGQAGHWAGTQALRQGATHRARLLANNTYGTSDTEPFTRMHELVEFLHQLKS